jgi:alkyldihydroxyacetonephosphate synthase
MRCRARGRVDQSRTTWPALGDIVGEEEVRVNTYTRLSVAYGKTMWDLYRLRERVMENLPDAVGPASRQRPN